MTERPTLKEVEPAARVLHEAGLHHHWWDPYRKTYDELASTDPIGKEEFDAIVESMLIACLAASQTFHWFVTSNAGANQGSPKSICGLFL